MAREIDRDVFVLRRSRSADARINFQMPDGIDTSGEKWECPISITWEEPEFKNPIDGAILETVQRYFVNVDEKELEKALRYDRNQYRKGYRDGYLSGKESGEWKYTDAFPHRVYCSKCYKTYVPNDRWQIWVDGDLPRKYCPNCGAKMKGANDE